MTPDSYCQDKTGGSGSSFYYSFMFLPKQRRQAITALYAFCREVDDVVDECAEPDIAKIKLAWWRQEIENLYKRTPEHPVSRALVPAIEQYNLKQEHFHEIIDGMEMDLHKNRYRDFDDLHLYCYRAASVVGLLAASIFGYKDEATIEYARKLGLAFQLTNIIRDVGEDARRNRIYIPADELARFNVNEADILQGIESDNFVALMQFQADRATRYYNEALSRLPDDDRKQQLPGLIMAAIYFAVLNEIEKDGYHVLKQKISLTPLRKLWIAWRTLWREKRLSKINLAQ
ncbi:MAG: presqualene diphosphate synthase HpnD [Gammaproteobacteria bacterium]|nr:MAG: presqualene diphosphate synthase HpnD [Gammaproteobacteria bacterium]